MTFFFQFLSELIWSPLLFGALIFLGAYFSVKLRFLQIRKLPQGLYEAFFHSSSIGGKGDISPFRALMTSLSATVGTGNIVGIAGALAIGGPGALFWLWVSAFLLMPVKYAEGFLAVKFRKRNRGGEYCGGPMYYIEHGLGKKSLAVIYAFCGLLASFGIGNMVQSNSMVLGAEQLLSVPPKMTAIITMILAGRILFGGIQRVGKWAGILTPFMALSYLLLGVLFLFRNYQEIIPALREILWGAVGGGAEPFVGGICGTAFISAMRAGISRGIFANEAGLGNGAIAAAAAKTNSPSSQGLVSMSGTFIDTLVFCSVTGLVLVISGSWSNQSLNAVAMTTAAFSYGFPHIGSIIVNSSLLVFAFTTIIGWSYYGERFCEYLFGEGKVKYYKLIFTAMIFIGTIIKSDSIWYLSDFLNGIMMIPNLIAIFFLRKLIIKERP